MHECVVFGHNLGKLGQNKSSVSVAEDLLFESFLYADTLESMLLLTSFMNLLDRFVHALN